MNKIKPVIIASDQSWIEGDYTSAQNNSGLTGYDARRRLA